MRRLWAGVLIASLPFAVLAQRGPVLRESQPPDQVVTPMPPPPAGSPTGTPMGGTDDTVTAAPLPPPDEDTSDSSQQMVPNPLDDPNAAQPSGPGKQNQQQGQPRRGGWVQMGAATLQALDKVNARGETFVVKVGDTGHFGSLNIAVRGCFVRAPDQPADATAFLVIRDQRPDAPAFTGWMVRSAPSMSMLAHPIYDVRVAGCTP